MPPVKISTSDLRPGMYVVDTKADWQNEPYLFFDEGIIKSMDEVSSILMHGYKEVYYDPDLSQIKEEEKIVLPEANSFTVPPPSVSLNEEMPMAERAYNDCIDHVRNFMQNVRDDGKVDLGQAEPLVTTIINSLNRNMDALTSLAKVKTYDAYTFEHCVNVSIYATAFGRFLGLDEQKLLYLGLAGVFHDTGKMLVSQEILNAPRRLSPEEFEIMKSHVQLGLDCLERSTSLPASVMAGVGQHHEKFNGTGYPNGLSGEQISPFGWIMSVVDIYDALTARRVYKDPMPCTKALSIMYGMRGEAWEEGKVERFIKMLGIYPVGTPVLISSGFRAVVSQSNPVAPLCPTILVVSDPQGKPILPPREIDLAKNKNITIKQALSPRESTDIDIPAVLGCAA